LGNEITEADTLGSVAGASVLERPEVTVSFKLKATHANLPEKKETVPFSKLVKIDGPGDILGIQANQVIRVHPASGVENFETNNLVYIEFYEEDFPWRYTPARPSGNRLRPWLALIVAKKDEFTRNTQGGTPTPYISIKSEYLNDVFYSQKDLDFFAHVHVLETLNENIANANSASGDIKKTIDQNPDLALSRIICPRKLEPGKDYYAFLVPAYETGRLAGLGEPTASILAQKPSWDIDALGDGSYNIPYYYSWNFKTSAGGDFESLARKLKLRTFPGNTGRIMDLASPGFGLEPEEEDATALVEGALKSLSHETPPWPPENGDKGLTDQLREILNLNENLQAGTSVKLANNGFYSPDPGLDPVIVPPVYGKWHAQTDILTADGKDWVHQLNLHPSHRAAAGLGTRVVQEHQEEFMEIAWNQIGLINEANRKIIENEAVRRTTERLFRKNIRKMDHLWLMNTVGKAMEVLRMDDNSTIKKALADSRVPTVFRTGTFMRVANNFTRTALMNRTGTDGAPDVLDESLVQRTNTDESLRSENPISAAPRRAVFNIQFDPVDLKKAIDAILDDPPNAFMLDLAAAIAKATTGTDYQADNVLNFLPADYNQTQKKRATDILGAVIKKEKIDKSLILTISPEVFEERISPNYDTGEYNVKDGPVNFISIVCFKKNVSKPDIILFQYSQLQETRANFSLDFKKSFLKLEGEEYVAKDPIIRPQKEKLQPVAFKDKVLHRFRPLTNYTRKIKAIVDIDSGDLSKPIMAYPRFPIPVYQYLKAISPDYIIPNISDIPANTIALMEPNKIFVESFLAGMNHEFSRELLWREFPTDMRGSYFRHFWEYDNDPANELLPGKNESEVDFNSRIIGFQDASADVKELHSWETLGDNHTREFGLVLLIKGDLFRKYPDTMVYAQKAEFKPGGELPRQLSDYAVPGNVEWPVITGMIEPDTYFFGFMLREADAKGNESSNPGYFFVLRERPGQISFGLDELTPPAPVLPQLSDWDNLTWQHIAGSPALAPKHLKVIGAPFNPKSFGNISWGNSSAHTAFILYQNPILYAKHASLFLKND
jgi:hypothetical protein